MARGQEAVPAFEAPAEPEDDDEEVEPEPDDDEPEDEPEPDEDLPEDEPDDESEPEDDAGVELDDSGFLPAESPVAAGAFSLPVPPAAAARESLR